MGLDRRNAPTPDQLADHRPRENTEGSAEQAEGAALVRFAIGVTATVESPEQLQAVKAKIMRDAATGIQIRMRSCDYNDDAAFSCNLGLGLPGILRPKTSRGETA